MNLRNFLLSELFADFPGVARDLPSVTVTGIEERSDRVRPGDIFCAVRGAKFDGWSFVPDAIARGAAAILCEPSERVLSLPAGSLPVVLVENVREATAYLAAKLTGFPSKSLFTVGVTGTNGKTSVTWLIAELLARLGNAAAHIGTLGYRIVDPERSGARSFWEDSTHTTPDPISLQRQLAEARERGATAASIEVSSHGAVQWRSGYVDWDCAVFTNLTHDHLDFHVTFDQYGAAKELFFIRDLVRSAKGHRSAVLNVGDEWGCKIHSKLRELAPDIQTTGFSLRGAPGADATILQHRCTPEGSELRVRVHGEEIELTTKLIGEYNIANVLAAVTALVTHGFSPREVAAALAAVEIVPGRLELVAPSPVSVYVDYAHTPDALDRAQRSLREIIPGRLITVFGCGGDRDRAKRSPMGKIAGELADYIVVTSDNPRSEEPETIIQEILPGVRAAAERQPKPIQVIPDRRQAIRHAVSAAQPGDAVLVAGKGHENYQEVKGVRSSFCDVDECRLALQASGHLANDHRNGGKRAISG